MDRKIIISRCLKVGIYIILALVAYGIIGSLGTLYRALRALWADG